ncbi:MAG: CBS domain-containing protein [Candidatus Omnitrophota bacterium]
MKVKDVMIKKVKSVLPDLLVSEALDILSSNKISGLPVINKEDKLVGMFTEKEILQNILPGYLKKVGSFVYQDNPKAIANKVKELLQGKKVFEIMREEIITVSSEVPLSEVARTMITEKIRRIPVVDEQGNVIGIISREDVVKSFIKGEI